METFSALLALCVGNSPVTGEPPSQRPVTRSLDIFFDMCLSKRLGKRTRRWWFETPSRSLWRHCNVCGLFGTPSEGGPIWHVSVVMGNKLNYGMLPQPQVNQRVCQGTSGNSGSHFQLWLVGSGSRSFFKHFKWPHWNLFPNNFRSENMDISSFETAVMKFSMFSTWHQYIWYYIKLSSHNSCRRSLLCHL